MDAHGAARRGPGAPAGQTVTEPTGEPGPRRRADAQRNVDALLAAAARVFATSGVDAPVRAVAAEAGVGVGTLYRHFPQRADLVAAVFRREVDAAAAEAPVIAAQHPPDEALMRWLLRYTEFLAAKRGLSAALHSGDPVFESLPEYFDQRLRPALEQLLASARTAGTIRGDVDARELLRAVALLSQPSPGTADPAASARHMVTVLLDGLRHRPSDDRSPGDTPA